MLVDLVLSDAQLKALPARGARAVRVVQHQQDGTRRYLESVRAHQVSVATVDTLFVKSAYWWTSKGQNFLQTLVATAAVSDPDVQITVSWRIADGTTGSFPLQRFEDAGEYQPASIAAPASTLSGRTGPNQRRTREPSSA